jgi:hypothetical protein
MNPLRTISSMTGTGDVGFLQLRRGDQCLFIGVKQTRRDIPLLLSLTL